MRKIVFINQATGYLTIDIINAFAKEFDMVALITGSIRVQDDTLESDVEVSKIVKYNRGSHINKVLSWLWGTVQIYFLLLFKYRDYEKVFFTIPPTAYLLPITRRLPFSIIIYDLYPEALKINGLDERSLIYKWWIKRNIKILPKAHKVYTLSDHMKEGLLYYAPKIKIEVISNWSAFSEYYPIAKAENKLLIREGLQDKFIIQYSGNIGATHNVEAIIELAEYFKENDSIVFQIIGRGIRTEIIADMIKAKKLKNCLLLPFRPDEELYESLCAADLAIVTLDDKTADVSVPSKTYNLMAAGVPVMAIASINSALAKKIADYKIGTTFEKDNYSGMSDFILNLFDNPDELKTLCDNSYKASKFFSKANAGRYLSAYLNN
nr:glycosyltransferase family 4 protein [uncultured Carboxylicivirga sp.]